MFDNSAGVSFLMESGATGQIDASWASHLGRSARGVIGEKGTAILCGRGQWDFSELRCKISGEKSERVELIDDLFDRTDSYYEENLHFLRCVKTGVRPLTTGNDGLQALRVSKAILRSAEEGRAVAVTHT